MPHPAPATTPDIFPAPLPPPNTNIFTSPSRTFLCRITNTNQETCNNNRYKDQLFYHSILDPSLSYQDEILYFHADTETYFQSGLLIWTDLCEYVDSHKSDPNGNEHEYYITDMNKKIAQLTKHKNLERVKCNGITTGPYGNPRSVLKGTWEFKLKLLSISSTLRYKLRYCMCTDIKTAGVD